MTLVPIRDLVMRPIPTVDPRALPDTEFTYVDIGSVDNAAKRIMRPVRLLGRNAPSRARQRLKSGDVLVATTRPYLNAVAQVPPDLDGQVGSTGFCVLRPGPVLDSEFLWYWTQHPLFVSGLSALIQGAMYPAVTDTDVLTQPMPSIPIGRQRRVAAHLTSELAIVERARDAATQRLREVEKLTTSALNAALNSAIPGSPVELLGQVAAIAAQQVDPRDAQYRNLPLVNGENIEARTGRLLFRRTAASEHAISPKYLCQPGDVLYSKLRPYLRKVVIADERELCSADMYPLQVDRNRVDPGWLAWTLVGDRFSAYAVSASARARMPKLNRDQLFSYRLAVPPLRRQREIANWISDVHSVANKIRDSVATELAGIEALSTALLRQAFEIYEA